MINKDLREKLERIIEIKNISWNLIEQIVQKDANILRPIKGVAFEEFFKKVLKRKKSDINIEDGVGDSDVDLVVNGFKLQLKTIDKGSTKENSIIGVALHKTHGNEKRPFNLYKKKNRTFHFLVVLHPVSGIFIIPFNEIPEHNNWPGYLDDPAKFVWGSEWINRWHLLGLKDLDGVTIDDRTVPSNSELPFLSSETYLEDYEIIEMLCKPEYFRAAVMGLKGNIKEQWFIDYLKSEKYYIKEPNEAYPKYDILLKNKNNKYLKTQIKGTSKNMCDVVKKKIGVEVMGTHGQFPKRGYKKSMIDYIAIIISEEQLKNENVDFTGLHFIMIPVSDLPLHYKIGKGKKVNKSDWDKKKFSDVIYPNIKLYFKYDKSRKNIFFLPDLSSYRKSKKHETIPKESIFRKAGPYYLDEIPNEF